MATLAQLVAQLPMAYRYRYDFESFWVPRCNEVLKLIVQMTGLPDNVKEVGCPIKHDRWITMPPLCRKPLSITAPYDTNSEWPFDIVNEKIRLKDAVSIDQKTAYILSWESASEVIIEYGMSSLLTLPEEITPGALLVLTNNDGVINGYNNTHVIAEVDDDLISNSAVVTLLHPLSDEYATNTRGYVLTSDEYLMLKYISDYPDVGDSTSEVPLSDKYEKAIITGLRMKIMEEIEDVSLLNQWHQLMQWELGLLNVDSGKLRKLKSDIGQGQENGAKG